jgi:DNA primase large subunit
LQKYKICHSRDLFYYSLSEYRVDEIKEKVKRLKIKEKRKIQVFKMLRYKIEMVLQDWRAA